MSIFFALLFPLLTLIWVVARVMKHEVEELTEGSVDGGGVTWSDDGTLVFTKGGPK